MGRHLDADRRVLRRRAGLRRGGAAPAPAHRDVSHERFAARHGGHRCLPGRIPRPEAGRDRHLARAHPRGVARPQSPAEARRPHLPRDPPAISAAAYLLVLRYPQLQELPAVAAQFPPVLAAARRSRRRSRARAHRPAGDADLWAGVASGARGRGAIRAEAPAIHGRAAGPGAGLRPGTGILRARQSGTRRRRHADLPVPADPLELAQPRPEGAAAAGPAPGCIDGNRVWRDSPHTPCWTSAKTTSR